MTSWFDGRLIAIDTETTGLTDEDRVVEIACVVAEGGRVVFERTVLLNPERPIPAEAMRVHGISDDVVKECKRFADIAPHVLARIESGKPVAYNAPFDHRMISLELQRCGLTMPRGAWIDPHVWVKQIDKYERGKKLTDACRRRGIKMTAHRALGDARAALELLFALRGNLPADVTDLLNEQVVMAAQQEAEFADWKAKNPKQEVA